MVNINLNNIYMDKVYTDKDKKDEDFKSNIYIDNLRFKKTVCFFYDTCINRVNKNRLQKRLSKFQIYDTDDKSLVCNFFNGVCTKNNPYLITEKLIGFVKKQNVLEPSTNETGKKIGFVHTLDFKTHYDVLWGTNFELQKNLPLIFRKIIYEIPEYLPSYATLIESILNDYIPYAKYTTLAKIKENNKISLLSYYGVYDEEVAPIRLAIHRERALNYLYAKLDFRSAFEGSFKEFIKDLKSFTKIDKKLEKNYIIPKFIPLLKEYTANNNSSLGLRVKDLLENDMSKVLSSVSSSKTAHEKSNDNIARMLTKVSSSYITELEKIQEQSIDQLFYI